MLLEYGTFDKYPQHSLQEFLWPALNLARTLSNAK